jgi:hypothetical protein
MDRMTTVAAAALIAAASGLALACNPSGGSGCTKDSDCKGVRVCVDGACVSPRGEPAPQSPPAPPAPEDPPQAQPSPQRQPAAPRGPCAQPRDVSAHAGQCVIASDPRYFDKGIVNQYRQVVQLTLVNKSQFAVTGVSGSVTWIDESGAATGTVPFSATGVVPPGGVLTVSKSSGTLSSGVLQTKAKTARVTVGRAEVVQ